MKFSTIVSNLEDFGTYEDTGPIEESDVIDGITATENILNNAENIRDCITDAEDSVKSIDNAQKALKGSEPITAFEVATVESLLSHVHETLGLTRVSHTSESFSNISRNELIATLESNKTGILEKIKIGLKAFINIVAGFFKSIINNRYVLGGFLKILKAKVESLPDDYGNGKSHTVKSKIANLKTVENIHVYVKKKIDTTDKYTKVLERLVDNFKNARETSEVINEQMKMEQEISSPSRSDMEETALREYIKNYPDYENMNSHDQADIRLGFQDNFKERNKLKYIDGGNVDDTAMGDRLNKKEMLKAINVCENILKDLGEAKHYMNFFTRCANGMIRHISDVVARVTKSQYMAEMSASRRIREVASEIMRGIFKWSLQAVSDIMKYVKASMA